MMNLKNYFFFQLDKNLRHTINLKTINKTKAKLI